MLSKTFTVKYDRYNKSNSSDDNHGNKHKLQQQKKGNNNNNNNKNTVTQVTIKTETKKYTNFKIEILYTIKRTEI